MFTSRRRFALVVPALLAVSVAVGQEGGGKVERMKSEETARFEDLVKGTAPVTPADKPMLDKMARFLYLKIAETGRGDDQSSIVLEANRKVLRQALPGKPIDPNVKGFYAEYGAAAVQTLDRLVFRGASPMIRVNATRMLADLGHTGYEGVAEPLMKVIALPDTLDTPERAANLAQKNYAYQGLENLFAAVDDPANLDKSPFKTRALEHKAIEVLVNAVTKPLDVTPEMAREEVAALHFVRQRAIRALGRVHLPTVQFEEKVICRPGLVLLRAARGEGLSPPPTLGERTDALLGYLQLAPERDLKQQPAMDVAAFHVGNAFLDWGRIKNEKQNDLTIQWHVTASKLVPALENWRRGCDERYRTDPNVKLARELAASVTTNILNPIIENKDSSSPDPQGLRDQVLQTIKVAPDAPLIKGAKEQSRIVSQTAAPVP